MRRQKGDEPGGLFAALLRAPDAPMPWDEIESRDWWRAMAACPQDPVYHAEGDVATHTRMVVDELRALPEWQELEPEAKGVLLLAALLHDAGKPDTTREEPDGRITSNGHSSRGAILARRLLWEEGEVPFARREAVCALVRWHQRPFYLIESDDSRRAACRIAETARCDRLALLARADARGRRIATDGETRGLGRALLNIDLFSELCAEAGCLSAPFPFPSDHSRFLYYRTPGRDPDYAAHDDTRGEMLLTAGLPGAGKDTWLRRCRPDLPVVSLDAIRTELKISPRDNQEAVAARARERAREYLRRGEPFAWNATNVSRELRAMTVNLAAEYRARVRLVYVEAPARLLREQNRLRADTAVDPDSAMGRMLRRWEVPDRTEAHTVDYAAGSEAVSGGSANVTRS